MYIEKPFISGRCIPPCRRGFFSLLFAGMVGLALFSTLDAAAQGNLLVTPKRIVFEGNKRSADISLANTGKDTALYAISLVQIRMKEDGTFEQITEPDPGQKFADKNIRFFPRTVTLGPGESQSVKVQVLNPKNLVPGEYRSHFYFRAIPKAEPLGEQDKAGMDTTAFTVRITPIFGITIPVIIRIGESDTRVTITDLGFSFVNDTVPNFKFTFRRTGNMSVYGDISVDHISAKGNITRVGIANGVAVYTPNAVRRFQMNLNKLPSVDFTTGTLRIIYSAPSDVKPVRYAEAEIMLR
jgi:hypothetical protein